MERRRRRKYCLLDASKAVNTEQTPSGSMNPAMEVGVVVSEFREEPFFPALYDQFKKMWYGYNIQDFLDQLTVEKLQSIPIGELPGSFRILLQMS